MSSKEEFEIIRQIAWDAVGTNIETADKALVKIHEYAKEQAARAHGGGGVPKSLIEACEALKKDLLLRGEQREDGIVEVNASDGIWSWFKNALEDAIAKSGGGDESA